MKKINPNKILMALLVIILFTACKKNWLDSKPTKSLVVPATVADYQALLDNTKGGGAPMNINLPSLSMVGDGDYFIADADYNGLGFPPEQGAYVWAATPDFYGGQASGDWVLAYSRILNDNVVLDGMQSLKVDISAQPANNVIGSALFFRSLDFYNLAQQYCKVYDPTTANTDLGLPLRVSANINLTVNRASVQQTYDQMIIDLAKAIPLLPVTPLYPTRPSKPAAFGLLARIYLSQENYSKALLYADSCLQLQNGLMDFNELKPSNFDPGIPRFNKEVIFHAQLNSYDTFDNYVFVVDPTLLQSYSANDLRTNIWFFTHAGNKSFWGSYIGDGFSMFGGIATDEIYLDRAECYARTGNITAAMNDLNALLKSRWKSGTFINLTASSADQALILIINERRKELCFRNLRWPDLRRLNKAARFQVTLNRTINGQTYTLAPNSPKYVLPIDPIEITIGGLQQNPR